MRKHIVILGLILIFAGIASTLTIGLPVTQTKEEIVKDASESWEISSYFQKGDNVSALFKWSVDFEELYEGDLPVNVTMGTSNSASETKFQVLFRMVDPRYVEIPPGRPPEYPIYTYAVHLLHLDSDTLAVSDPPRQVGGIVQQNATYTVRIIIDDGLWWAGIPPKPPLLIRLHKIVTITEYPFSVYAPIGTATTVFGAGLCAWGIKSTRHKARTRKPRH